MQNTSESIFEGAEVWVELDKTEGVLDFPFKYVKYLYKVGNCKFSGYPKKYD